LAIGVDIGGTFTDVALVEEESGLAIGVAKVTDHPADLAAACWARDSADAAL